MSDCRVGVDAGGSRVTAVVADARGTELARCSGPSVPLGEGPVEGTVGAVEEVVRAAVRRAGAELPARALWVGLAGAGREPVRQRVEQGFVARHLATHVRVGTDAAAAFASAFGEGPGILLIAGTGTIALARDSEGRRVRVGGWGAWLGDEGGGHWIAVRALRSVARAEDGRAQPTALRSAIMAHLEIEGPEDLIAWTDRATRGQLAALAPRVIEVARDGDPVASAIVTDAAAELRTHLLALVERLTAAGSADAADPPLRLALWGGLIAEGGALRPVLLPLLEPLGLELTTTPVDPALGAARLAGVESARAGC
ncbi:MAG: BadF/BadG/BcrA/BcrD ATPase family protein [Gemmatimonadota bacterium]|nr:BadF/BadG/BcrA/BcrD ATPase family protein [Gemmatimonadota bacterium]